jgi:hypothetical protein
VRKTKEDVFWRNKKVFLNGAAVENKEKEEFSPGCGDLSLQGNDGRNQRRLGPAVQYLRSWNRGSA